MREKEKNNTLIITELSVQYQTTENYITKSPFLVVCS